MPNYPHYEPTPKDTLIRDAIVEAIEQPWRQSSCLQWLKDFQVYGEFTTDGFVGRDNQAGRILAITGRG